mgnify:CR=1 FL=1
MRRQEEMKQELEELRKEMKGPSLFRSESAQNPTTEGLWIEVWMAGKPKTGESISDPIP